MENTNKNVEELFNPNLSQMYNDKFQELIFRMDNAYANYRVKVLKEEIETQKVSAESDVEELKYVASLRVLLDLIQQGWVMDIRAGALYLLFSSENSNNKDYIKYRLSFERNAQFEEKSIVQFIERMEKKRNFEGREISIKSLIGDSTALINKINNGEIIVSPYIQQVTNDKDIYTGYKLSDIWRYFRYTWSIPYKTMPGRNIYYLVRDEAQENHPVIGIFALGNSVLNLTVRDNDIGWTVDAVENSMARKQNVQKSNKQISQTEGKEVSAKIERFLESEEEYIRRTEEYANKLLIQLEANIKDALNDIYVKDLGYHRNTKHSDEEYIQNLRAQAEELRLKNLNNTKNDNVTDWGAEAESELFKKKRLIELAKLLETRNVFQKYHASSAREQIDKMLKRDDGRKAISAALIANRKNKIGANMMDIIVCGAIPPYNELLGGKLVSILACSPQVISDYTNRYKKQVSEIASRMKGKKVIRDSRLAYMGTTSLYAIGSSQYNRIKVPIAEDFELVYKKVGVTEGFGTVYFSKYTTDLLSRILEILDGGKKINHIFGEGTSPRFRLISRGVASLGLKADSFLQHYSPRIVYCMELAKNSKDFLNGYTSELQYAFDLNSPESIAQVTRKMSDFWYERWLQSRINTVDIEARLNAFKVEEFMLSRRCKHE